MKQFSATIFLLVTYLLAIVFASPFKRKDLNQNQKADCLTPDELNGSCVKISDCIPKDPLKYLDEKGLKQKRSR